MTKTKSQLRAEAVERLRELGTKESYPEEIVKTLVSADIMTNRYDYAIELDTIIDLLTDDEPQDVTTPEFDVPLYGWHDGDTREKLQAKADELEAENARLRSRISDDAEYGRLVMGAYRELRSKLDEIAKLVSA